MAVLITIVFTTIALFEIPGLIQKKYWPELVAFTTLLLLGFGLSLLLVFGVNLPYISDDITQGIKKIFSLK
jgi:hypothetical protein